MEINFRHEINGMKVITAVAQDAVSGEFLKSRFLKKQE